MAKRNTIFYLFMKRKLLKIIFILMQFLLFATAKIGATQYDPSGLGIQNAKLGARFDFDFQFANADYSNRKSPGVYTGVLGTEADNLDRFVVATFLQKDRSVESFRFGEQDPYHAYHNVSVSIELTRMKLEGYHQNNLKVSFIQINPFVPTDSLNQSDNLINIAPVFIQKLIVENLSDTTQTGYVLLSHSDAFEMNSDSLQNQNILLLQGENDNGGVRAFCLADTLPILEYEIGDSIFDHFNENGRLRNTVSGKKSQGGFSWYFSLRPGGKKSWTFYYAAYYNGLVMKDIRFSPPDSLRFAYTNWFHSVFDVLRWSIRNCRTILTKTENFEQLMSNSLLSSEEKFTISQAFHSYFPNTYLLSNSTGADLRYYVWEGQVKYISTLDVAYEVGLFEGLKIPWALKMQIQEWEKITHTDEAGIYFPHDLGRGDEITPQQAYAYLGADMAVEENCDYILLLYWYWKQTGADDFILARKNLLQEVLQSLRNRDSNHDGISDYYSFFTTIDQREAIHCAAENSYIGVKEIASFLASAEIFRSLQDSALVHLCKSYADTTMQTLMNSPQSAGNLDGRFPIIHYYGDNQNMTDLWNFYGQNDYCGDFPSNWNTATVIIPEGLLYLLLGGYDFSSLSSFIHQLMISNRAHFEICNQGHAYTYLSSEKERTWLSKLFDNEMINQYLNTMFPNNPHYQISAMKQAFSLLSTKANRGYSDAWENPEGDRRGLDYYPRGINSFGFLVFNQFDRYVASIPLKINCGGDSVDGWRADVYEMGQRGTFITADSIRGAGNVPMAVMQSESYGSDGTGYEIPVENGEYKVTLYFDEIYYLPGIHNGTRIFDISIEDSIYVEQLNIFERVGGDSVLKLGPFSVRVNDGYLSIVGLNHRGSDIHNKFNGIMVEYATHPNIYNIIVRNVRIHSAEIEWNTDIPTQGKIEYGLSDSLGNYSLVDSVFSFHHILEIDSLLSNSQYYYRVECWDSSLNKSHSAIGMFSTVADTTKLSVEIARFSLQIEPPHRVLLHWTMNAQENEIYGFEIQRASSRNPFERIGFVRSTNQGGAWLTYQYVDKAMIDSSICYRLKLIYNDGKFSYSKTFHVSNFLPEKIALLENYPNPFTKETNFLFFIPEKFKSQRIKIYIYNIRGQVVYQKNFIHLSNYVMFKWNGQNNSKVLVSSGIYFFVLSCSHQIFSQKVLFIQ